MAKSAGTSDTAKQIKLGRDLRIASAAGIYAVLVDAAKGASSKVAIDARSVEKADTAGVQALLAGRIALVRAGKRLSWTGCSAQLQSAAALLGLTEALDLAK